MTDTTEHDTGGTLGETGSIVDLGDARPRWRLRRAPPAGRGADRRLRALRLLPADLPDLRAVGRGDGLAARPDLPDEGGPRGRADDRLDGLALRRLPRLHGLRDRVPVGRAVRHPDRADPRPGRAPPRPLGEGQGAARADLLAVPAPEAAAAAARPAARCCRRPASTARCVAPACSTGCAPQLAAMERLAPRLGKPQPLPERIPASGPARAPSSACSPAACRARSSPASTPRPRGCSRPRAATSSCRRSQGCCGALSVHNGREPEGQDFARRLVDAFERPAWSTSWSTPPAAAPR